MILAGIFVAGGEMDFVLSLAVSVAGVLVGDSIVYLAGRRLGKAALNSPLLQKKLGQRRLRRLRALYRIRGERMVFFARFIMGIRIVAFFLAGALAIRYRRFLLLDGLAALLSIPVWIALGTWLGHTYGDDIQMVLDATAPARNAVGLVIAVVAAVVIVRWVRLLGKVKASTESTETSSSGDSASPPEVPRSNVG